MSNRKISDIIRTQQLLTAPATLTVRQAAQNMTALKVGAVMVVEGERLIGIFTERDALNRVLTPGLDPDRTPLSQVMTADPQTVTADHSLGYALHLMHIGGYRHMPVTHNGSPRGIVSVRDALGEELLEFEKELKDIDHITELL